ncbi:hypothetical protein C8R46DRAFT_1125237 [Mycena filopes]|nr:hypothetical protein C8R46DRAFT_1125237 [Mycena filopes]
MAIKPHFWHPTALVALFSRSVALANGTLVVGRMWVRIPITKQIRIPNAEQVRIPNTRRTRKQCILCWGIIRYPNTEQIREWVRIPNTKQIRIPNAEQIRIPNTRRI